MTSDATLLEVDEACNAISAEVDPDANTIFGAAFDDSLQGKIRVSVVATGMDGASISAIEPKAIRVSAKPVELPQPAALLQPRQQAGHGVFRIEGVHRLAHGRLAVGAPAPGLAVRA